MRGPPPDLIDLTRLIILIEYLQLRTKKVQGTVVWADVRPPFGVLEEHTLGASGSGGGGRIEGRGRDSWNVGMGGLFFFFVVVT
jgi:hypothetical protein